MKTKARRCDLAGIDFLRKQFLAENQFQVRYNACHERGWSNSYLLSLDEQEVGYGSIKGLENISERDAVFEFYVQPSYRKWSESLFRELVSLSGAGFIECQTNEIQLTQLLFLYSDSIKADVILFSAGSPTSLVMPDYVFRRKLATDVIFEHKFEPAGDYVLEYEKEIVATGGFLLHYNFPFADLYMEVKESRRRKGCGSFLIQELKKACYLQGRVPAARCSITNMASKATLLKAGMQISGFMLVGRLK